MLIAIVFIVFMLLIESVAYRKKMSTWFFAKPVYVRFAAYYAIVIAIICLGVFEKIQFVYFQF